MSLSRSARLLISLRPSTLINHSRISPTCRPTPSPFHRPLHPFHTTQARMGGKSEDQVIEEFQQYVNMTPDELSEWLETEESQTAGWSKANTGKVEEGQESVGHESGRKIIDILKRNPDGEPDEYTEEDIAHMRKVTSYCKRHLAQEEASLNDKSDEEAEKTKSYRSLKNWGHDALK